MASIHMQLECERPFDGLSYFWSELYTANRGEYRVCAPLADNGTSRATAIQLVTHVSAMFWNHRSARFQTCSLSAELQDTVFCLCLSGSFLLMIF